MMDRVANLNFKQYSITVLWLPVPLNKVNKYNLIQIQIFKKRRQQNLLEGAIRGYGRLSDRNKCCLIFYILKIEALSIVSYMVT